MDQWVNTCTLVGKEHTVYYIYFFKKNVSDALTVYSTALLN